MDLKGLIIILVRISSITGGGGGGHRYKGELSSQKGEGWGKGGFISPAKSRRAKERQALSKLSIISRSGKKKGKKLPAEGKRGENDRHTEGVEKSTFNESK